MSKRQRVVDFIRKHPGATGRQVSEGTDLYPMYAHAVVRQMLQAGRIKTAGRVKARNGRMAAKYQIKEAEQTE